MKAARDPHAKRPAGASPRPDTESRGGADAASFDARLRQASAARTRVLRTATNARVVAVLARTAAQWCRRDFAPRAVVTSLLAKRLAMHEEMLARGLDHLFGSIDECSLRELLAEAEDPSALEHDCTRAGGQWRLGGPEVVFYSLAGNVPGLSVLPIAASLLARSIAVIRDSARQPWLTDAFASTLAEHDADLAAMVVPVCWPAGDAAHERQVIERAARIEIYGSDATLRSVRTRHADLGAEPEIIERGSRLSVGLVTPEASDDCARGFADDAALYDGLGCLTPHAILVEGNREHAARFAHRLAAALEELERRWPRQPRSFALESSRRAFIDAREAQSLAEPEGFLLRGKGDAWIVHATARASLAIGPGLRCVRVIACGARARALGLIAHADAPLAAIGLAHDPGADRAVLARTLETLGATLVCEPGKMQTPPLPWRQDGRRRLGDLLTWREVEA